MCNMEEDNNKWSDDVLERKLYSTFLTDYLTSKESSFVINLNASWGSGKTFFIEHWFNDIKNKHPAVLFNAWKNDFSNDPLLSVISCINDSLIPQLPKSQKAKKSISSFFSTSGRLLKQVSPILAKGAASKVIGDEGIKELEDICTEDEKNIVDAIGKVTEKLISDNKKSENAVIDFQKSLTSIINNITTKKGSSAPLFIFIDELDRCRPLYAIELLERIKHLFGVPEVVFIIATDTGQLSHSVKAIYGNDFNAEIYLKRFFDQTYSLPDPDNIKFSKLLFIDFESDLSFFDYNITSSGQPILWYGQKNIIESNEYTLIIDECKNFKFILLFALFSKFFDLDLRSQKQCFEKFTAIISTINNSNEVHFAFLIFLIMLESKNPDIFKKYSSFNNDDPTSRVKIINNNLKSPFNIRISSNIYTANELIEFYSNYAFADKKSLNGIMNSDNPVTASLAMSLYNHHGDLRKYKNMVSLAGQLS